MESKVRKCRMTLQGRFAVFVLCWEMKWVLLELFSAQMIFNISFHNIQKSLTNFAYLVCFFSFNFCCFLLTLVMFHPFFFHSPVCNQLLHSTKAGHRVSFFSTLLLTMVVGWLITDLSSRKWPNPHASFRLFLYMNVTRQPFPDPLLPLMFV